MNIRNLLFSLVALSTLLFSSCGVEEYDLDSVSTKNLMLETSLDAPLASVDLRLSDVFKHRGSKGKFITTEGAYDLAQIVTDEQIPLPAMVLNETSIIAVDSFVGVNFEDAIGHGNVVDSILEARLKLSIENELPFDVDITLKFVCVDSFIVTTRPLVKEQRRYVSESLNRTFHIQGSDIDAETRKLVRSSVSRPEVIFTPEDNTELKKVKDILMEYSLTMPVNRAFVAKDYRLTAKLSAFMRANISLND